MSLVWHLALSVPRGNAMSHVSVTMKYHWVDFNLVPIYVFLIQFSPYLCVFDTILSQFFLIIKIFL